MVFPVVSRLCGPILLTNRSECNEEHHHPLAICHASSVVCARCVYLLLVKWRGNRHAMWETDCPVLPIQAIIIQAGFCVIWAIGSLLDMSHTYSWLSFACTSCGPCDLFAYECPLSTQSMVIFAFCIHVSYFHFGNDIALRRTEKRLSLYQIQGTYIHSSNTR